MEAVLSERVGVCKTNYLSSRDEFQCITDRNLTFICSGVVFLLLIIFLILPILQLSSEMNDPSSFFRIPRCKFFLGVPL